MLLLKITKSTFSTLYSSLTALFLSPVCACSDRSATDRFQEPASHNLSIGTPSTKNQARAHTLECCIVPCTANVPAVAALAVRASEGSRVADVRSCNVGGECGTGRLEAVAVTTVVEGRGA